MDSKHAALVVCDLTPRVCEELNIFCKEWLRTRGQRIGSGMGGLLEALWGFFMNAELTSQPGEPAELEMGWLGHQYNDFACLLRNADWDGNDRSAELYRIEVKSMNMGADESKAHFDGIRIGQEDLLLALVWKWAQLPVDESEATRRVLRPHVYPRVVDHFIGSAEDVAMLRDRLHVARGGSFVSRDNCPDGCIPSACRHDGEPLNEAGKRERVSGPGSTRVSKTTSYAGNFGGLVRMLKTASPEARDEMRRICRTNATADRYVAFIHRNYPDEELNQYSRKEWERVATSLGIQIELGLNKADLAARVREESSIDYAETLRKGPNVDPEDDSSRLGP